MKRKTLIIGGIAAATVLVGGWALAQSAGHGPDGMRGMGPGMHGHMGPGMNGQMGPGMRGQMGPGMMGMGLGMMGGSATMDERRDLHDLFFNHDRIKRAVTNLPDGIRTVTESDDPRLAETIKKHVAEMGQRVEEGRDPGLPIETPALHAIFRHKDKIKTTYEATKKGIIVVQTSTDATAVKALQDHAAEVTDLAQRGMVAAHEAMMKNRGGIMGRGMHMRGAIAEPHHED
ncbi:MAG TPA: hypothetical protein VMT72_04070 [Pseudolabrys sp.]|nr:hypothetical protein [Pseudolabrys sp.]